MGVYIQILKRLTFIRIAGICAYFFLMYVLLVFVRTFSFVYIAVIARYAGIWDVTGTCTYFRYLHVLCSCIYTHCWYFNVSLVYCILSVLLRIANISIAYICMHYSYFHILQAFVHIAITVFCWYLSALRACVPILWWYLYWLLVPLRNADIFINL